MSDVSITQLQAVAGRIAGLGAGQRRQLFGKLMGQGVNVARLPIVPASEQGPQVLSYAQQRQWFLWEFAPQDASSNMTCALRLVGALDVPALRAALAGLMQRHTSLRSRIVLVDDEPRQDIAPMSDVRLPFEVCGGVQDEAALSVFIERQSRLPFDLTLAPPLRVSLVPSGADEHVLVIVVHHIACDGWSMQLMVEDWLALYTAEITGQPARLPDLPVSYGDYAAWQRQWLEAGEGERQLAWWRDHLEGGQASLQLPVDRLRTGLPDRVGKTLALALAPALGKSLQALAKTLGVTDFVLLLAAFQVLLYRYSGQGTVRVGVPVANRNRAETERLIGLFVNTQVVQTEMQARTPFAELARRLGVTAREAQAYQDLPFEQLVQALQPERDLARTPLFQVMFNHQVEGGSSRLPAVPGLRLQPVQWSAQDALFDLSLNTYDSPDGLGATLTYATDLFDDATVQRLGEHLLYLLRAIVEQPEAAVADLPLLDPVQARATLGEWNRTRIALPARVGVHLRFEAQVARNPDAPALMFAGERLTYGELNRRANPLAHWLIGQGVGPDVPVGICTLRGPEMIVALLAVLKAGGAYVPLDPGYPAERLEYMLRDSGSNLLLTQARLGDRLPAVEGVRVLALDGDDWVRGAEDDPPSRCHADQLAYMIYTSGSTGRPKGVMVRHAALDNFVQAMADAPGIVEGDRVLSLTTFSFDIFGLEIHVPLATGACVVLTEQEQNLDPDALLGLIEAQRVDVVQATPSSWRMLLDSPAHTVLQGRRLLCGGEALAEDLALRLGRLSAQVWNLYGPTETTIWSARHRLPEGAAKALLGQPIDNTELYIVDGELNPVPIGVPGELLIGGEGLARGYFLRPGLSAERFVPNPLGPLGSRLYRTGDLARYRADGQIEYLGRIDQQVKIRGFRIEPGEIEARLLEHAGVREAAVVVREVAGSAQLVAYLVEDADTAPRTLVERLKSSLRDGLPDYMVPAHWVSLDSMPRTPNGKLDRNALPVPHAEPATHAYRAPRTDLQQRLAAIWRDVLGIEQVGLDDHFFDLGGHSLLATQVIARIRREVTGDAAVRDLFTAPDLAGFARLLEHRAAAGETRTVPPLEAMPEQALVPLSLAQRRLWVAAQFAPRSAAYGMPLALRLRGPVCLADLEWSLQAVIRRHAVLRTAYLSDDEGDPVGQVFPDATLALAVEDLSPLSRMEQEARVAQATLDNLHQHIDLEQAPLMRSRVLRLGDREHVVLYAMHHIISDGWSMAVLTHELLEHYQARCEGRPVSLPPLPLQYSDYARWQLEMERTGALAIQAEYWRETLAGSSGKLELPVDLPRPEQASQAGGALSLHIPTAVVARLRQHSLDLGVTLYNTLLASFQVMLHRFANVDDLLVGADVAGRQSAELEGLIGFFVNILPLRSRFDPAQTFAQFAIAARDTALAAFEHQDLPLDMIVEASGVPRHKGYNPLLQVLFVMNNLPVDTGGMPGVHVDVLPSPGGYSKFDMALFIDEQQDGLLGTWQYASDLFRQERIAQLVNLWTGVLEQVATDPHIRLREINMPSDTLMSSPATTKADKLGRFLKKPAGPVTRSLDSPLRETLLVPGQPFPLLIEPNDPDLDLATWVTHNRALLEEKLCRHAGLLFRGFRLNDIQAFEAFAEAVQPGLYGQYGDLPKKEGGKNTYRSTPYPEKKMILFHNESSHQDCWPRKQLFFCEQPSPVGGATPVVDCRLMYQRMPAPLRERFERKGLLYVRTFARQLDVSWQHFFKTEDRAEVEARCAASGIGWQWLDNDELQIRTPCPAVITHPVTGEKSFFNQVQLHHIQCLDPDVREDLLGLYGEQRLPRHVFFGDGSTIEDETMRELGELYEACAVRFDWRKGDVILLDNMLAAHARDPFEGPRKIVVAMGEMIHRSSLSEPDDALRTTTEKEASDA